MRSRIYAILMEKHFQSANLLWPGLQRMEACSDIEIFNLSPTLLPNLAATVRRVLLFCNPQYPIPNIDPINIQYQISTILHEDMDI